MVTTKKRTVVELHVDSVLLLEALNACETDDEALAILDEQLQIEAELAEKLERLHAVQRRAEAEASYIREEEKRLEARRKRSERVVARVKDLAQLALETHRELTGESKVVTSTLTARLQRGPKKLHHPTESDAWPRAYVTMTPVLDRSRLKADLARGVEVEGCSLSQPEHVRWA